MTEAELQALVSNEDWMAIEEARGPGVAPHVPGLIALYDALDAWPQKLAVAQLLQDQEPTAELSRVMLDVLRAPDVHDWLQDTVELTKAVALGILDAEHANFSAFYTDRALLRETVRQVLSAHALEQVPSPPPPPSGDRKVSETLAEAVAMGDVDAIRSFAAAGADLNAPVDHGHIQNMPPLILALTKDHLAAVDVLLACGADPNVVRSGGQTALSWAVFKGHHALVVRLVELGGDVQQADQWGATLVKTAAEYGYIEILDHLIAHGAPIDRALADGRTAMWFAAEGGKTAAVLRLLAAGWDVDRIDSGSAPLHLAARNNASRLLDALLKAGASCDLRDAEGRTPLMLAARGGYPNLVKKLLRAGADPSLRTPDGRTAADLAGGKRADAVRAELAGHPR